MGESEQLQAISVGDVVYHYLRQRMLSGHFKPGERINENAVAEQLGVSRAPVREGVLRLAGEGLLEVVPRRGAFAITISPAKVTELSDVRAVLEGFAAGKIAVGATDEELEHLRAQTEGLKEELDDSRVFPRGDFDFHAAVVRLAGNETLDSLFATINAQILFLRGVSGAQEPRARTALDEHLYILDAIERRDADLAERRMREHIERAKESFLTYLSTSSEG